MKNIKATPCFVITFAIISISCAGSEKRDMGERLGKELGEKLGAAIGKSITEAAPTLGANAAQFIGEAGKDISKNLAEGVATGLENGAANIGTEAVQKLVPVAGAIAGIYALKEVVYIGKDLYQYNYPDEKEIALREAAQETIDVIRAKRGFRECLMQNARTAKNKTGIPVNCEECGQKYSMTAGNMAFNDMAETFKKTYQNL